MIRPVDPRELEKFVDLCIAHSKDAGMDHDEINRMFLRKQLKQMLIEPNYQIFVEKHETELLWNTLIFQLYRNQTNINVIDVENEVAKIKVNKSEEELKKIRNDIENKRKEEKFNLFSRSHFSNLENTVVINFQ